jgi:hypothetical protein
MEFHGSRAIVLLRSGQDPLVAPTCDMEYVELSPGSRPGQLMKAEHPVRPSPTSYLGLVRVSSKAPLQALQLAHYMQDPHEGILDRAGLEPLSR